MAFLPVTKQEIKDRGWEVPDFVYVCGDAYVDHPSFGAAIISRVLESAGFRVAILCQPDWHSLKDIERFGRPRLAFLVSSGNIDSMVNHSTVAKRRRSEDVYSPGGKAGLRPDRAVIVYCNLIRRAFGHVPIVLGGIEASLRRLSHYDYWDNKVRRSILLDSAADLLIYGMGEHQIVEMAEALDSGLPVEEITFLRGTVYKTKQKERAYGALELPPFAETKTNKKAYAKSFLMQYENTDAIAAQPLIEAYEDGYVVQNPPAMPLSTEELDRVYALPYERTYHPMYEKDGGIPAIREVKFSLASNRGCFGGCNFCALTFHQGRVISARSHESLVAEAKKMTQDPEFKGYIHDVGGPTANFRIPACKKQKKFGACKDRQCLFPKPCPNLQVDHRDYVALLRKLRAIEKVKKVFIRSGIRYDYLIYDSDETFFHELCQYHISGQLKVAPEHVVPRVLQKMGKPGRDVYDRFVHRYEQINRNLGMKQYLVPYLMSSHPGSDLAAAVELAEYLRDTGHRPEQVQDFYPTPGTLSTAMYYLEFDPRTGEKVYVPKNPHEKAMQRALMQYTLPRNYDLVKEALLRAHRPDLIGYGRHCLIPPRPKQELPTKTQAGKSRGKPSNQPSPTKKKTIRQVHQKHKPH